MSRCVDQVQLITLAVNRGVDHSNCGRLDRNTLFALQVHVIQHLLLHVPLGDGAGGLQQPVGQSALAVGQYAL